jgi:hypothetical protein
LKAVGDSLASLADGNSQFRAKISKTYHV